MIHSAHFEGTIDRLFGAPSVSVVDAVSHAVKGTGTATADRWGWFSGTLRDNAGKPVTVEPGDRVLAPSVAADADWIVPDVSVTANRVTDRVRGRCFDAGMSANWTKITVLRRGEERGWAIGSTGSDGRFWVDFRWPWDFFFDPANIRGGDVVNVGCMQTNGDWAHAEVRVPRGQ